MKLGEGVEWALHSCTVLALVPPDSAMSAARLAEFHGVPPAYLAKHLQPLSPAGIIESVAGRRGGYRLARPAADITVLEIVQAVEGSDRAFRCTEIRRRGPAAAAAAAATRRSCGIAKAMYRAENAWRAELRGHDPRRRRHVAGEPASRRRPRSSRGEAALAWFQEVMS